MKQKIEFVASMNYGSETRIFKQGGLSNAR